MFEWLITFGNKLKAKLIDAFNRMMPVAQEIVVDVFTEALGQVIAIIRNAVLKAIAEAEARPDLSGSEKFEFVVNKIKDGFENDLLRKVTDIGAVSLMTLIRTAVQIIFHSLQAQNRI